MNEERESRSGSGRLVAIGVATHAGKAMRAREAVELVPGVGIPGDRYAEGGGTWRGYPDREVTLVEAEAAGVAEPLLLRRNLVICGVGGLVGGMDTENVPLGLHRAAELGGAVGGAASDDDDGDGGIGKHLRDNRGRGDSSSAPVLWRGCGWME